MLLRHNVSLVRQPGLYTNFDPQRGVSIATLAYDYPAGSHVPEHAHGSGQLIYAIRGVMEVFAGQSVWLIPPHFALWVPGRTYHRIRMHGAVSMRTLYLRQGLSRALPKACVVLHVTPLMRELVVEAVRVGKLHAARRHERALRDLLVQQLENAPPVPTFVTMPVEPRALAVAQWVLADPGQSRPLAALCAAAGVSVRTVERAFRRDAGMDFESWRRQVRLMKAVELLVSGRAIKEVAFAVGYRQPSAFVQMFRRTLGATPKAWITELKKLDKTSAAHAG